MKTLITFCSCFMALVFTFCGTSKSENQEIQKQSFDLTYCDTDTECKEDFSCVPVYCDMKCSPDGTGKCVLCNNGKKGKCLPDPVPKPCKDTSKCGACGGVTCNENEECVHVCSGLCDDATKKCTDVWCEAKCQAKGCISDSDCGNNQFCEKFCAYSEAYAAWSMKCGDSTKCPDVPPLPDSDCVGKCTVKPDEPGKCDSDKECKEGFICEPVFCTMLCIPDEKGGCLPCNDGKMGICVPKPEKGCMSDKECKEGEKCEIMCASMCDSFNADCPEKCSGKCIPKKGCESDKDCGEGFTCEQICVSSKCPENADCATEYITGECFGQCIPKKPEPKQCMTDKDCDEGFICEPVFCAMDMCIPDKKGGCLPPPCNDGKYGICTPKPDTGCSSDKDCKENETCEIYCMGLCSEDTGCKDVCKGVCKPKEKGCGAENPCPAGYKCVMVCVDCAPDTDCQGGCFGECIPENPEPKKCNKNEECSPGYHCEPVFCTMNCIPDQKGGCLPCNEGFIGVCTPDPDTGCKTDADCAKDEECQVYCMGLCDPNAGCGETCKGVCVPKTEGCKTDSDCPEGFHCELMCNQGCMTPMDSASGSSSASNCPDAECFGQCIENKPEPKKCNTNKDCDEGFICEPVLCPAMCAPDGKGGCLPCNDGFIGVCIPEPETGCMQDSDCDENEICEVYCTGFCDPSAGCADMCKGICKPKEQGCKTDAECGEGFHCETVCSYGCQSDSSYCGEGSCFGICVKDQPEPKKCNFDKDCGEGYICEPVLCTTAEKDSYSCIPDEKGGCLPCNDGFVGVCVPKPVEGCDETKPCPSGQECKVVCMGLCTPEGGCSKTCIGECVPKGGCKEDKDCAEGFMCEILCPPCTGTASSGSDSSDSETPLPCIDMECYGQCVPKPLKCDFNKDCPEGFHCEPVMCPMMCMDDGKGGCLPCNDGYAGICVQNPPSGCVSDDQCKTDEMCKTVCDSFCDPTFGCKENCQGVCVKKDDVPPSCFCTAIYKPVCGTDGKTYGNSCEAYCAGTGIKHEGPCESECKSDKDCDDSNPATQDKCDSMGFCIYSTSTSI